MILQLTISCKNHKKRIIFYLKWSQYIHTDFSFNYFNTSVGFKIYRIINYLKRLKNIGKNIFKLRTGGGVSCYKDLEEIRKNYIISNPFNFANGNSLIIGCKKNDSLGSVCVRWDHFRLCINKISFVVVDFVVLVGRGVEVKEGEKLEKYEDRARDLRRHAIIYTQEKKTLS